VNDVVAPGAQGISTSAWTAKMVRPLSDRGVGTPASFVTRRFTLDKVQGTETLRISALGLYRCFINGKRVGKDLLTPGWTAYDKRLSYQTYAVGDLLKAGENEIEIWLADGWLRSQMMWGQAPLFNVWGKHIAAIAELFSRWGDLTPVLVTDATWQSGELPVRQSGIYFGEVHDARFEKKVTAGTEVLPFDTGILVPHETTPPRELAPIAPVKTWVDAEGRTVYDFGQNHAGYVAFTVSGEAGARVTVEHGEVLDKDKQFYNGNYRTAVAKLEYTLSGRGEESWRPIFTFQGYRYVRVTITGKAKLSHIESIPVSSVTEQKATFTSSNAFVNRLVLNTLWSQRSNFIDVPTDCPQRDERLGWTGDAQVFAGTACYLGDAHGFLVKYVRDLMADQRENGAIPHVSPDPTRMQPEHYPGFFGSTGWGDAIAVIPWQLYLHYGDTAILGEALPAMTRWVDFVWSIGNGPIVKPPRQWSGYGFTFSDWLQPSGPSAKPLPTIGDDAAATIYLFITSTLVGRIARIAGKADVAERMEKIAAEVKAAFADEFITASGRLAYDDQTSYALAFLHDLIPEEKREAARAYFKASILRSDGKVGTGFIGTPALLPALVKIGEPGIAADLFLQEGVPGWLYQVKMGATTIWERWDAMAPDGTIYNPQMNSYNHYAYGAVCQWLLEGVAGFRPDPNDPGFATVVYEPVIVAELSPVAATHDSPRGQIKAGWTVENGKVRYTVTVPSAARGVLKLTAPNISVDGAAWGGGERDLAPGDHTITFDYVAPEHLNVTQLDINARTP
jgi:alpha-L-rhamnosidase